MLPEQVLKLDGIRNKNGRRLFLRSEFGDHGFHKGGKYVWTRTGATSLVVEDMVFDQQTRQKVSLTKQRFYELAHSLEAKVDFSGFEPLFQSLEGITNELSGKCAQALRVLGFRAANKRTAQPREPCGD